MAQLPPLVAVAHGSRDPRAAATVTSLLSVTWTRAIARGWPGLDVRAAFLDHCAPSLPQVLGSVAETARGQAGGAPVPCVVLPLLLTAAYHAVTDIPAQLAAAGGTAGLDVARAGTLGPHPLLLAAMERRLAEAGVGLDAASRAATSVVLAAAGSSHPAANAANARLAARWQASGGWRRVAVGYASAASPSPAEAVRALRAEDGGPVVVASYLLAPGYFADKIREGALDAGAAAVSWVLGAAPEVADVILDRYAAAAARVSARAAQSIVARAQLSGTRRGDYTVTASLRAGRQTWNDAITPRAHPPYPRVYPEAGDGIDAHTGRAADTLAR